VGRVLVALAVFALAPPTQAAAHKYRVEQTGDSEVRAGGRAMLSLRLIALEGAYIHADAPLRIRLSAEGPLALDRGVLTRGDAIDPRAGENARELGFRFPVGAAEDGAGAGAVRADVSFYVCVGTWCRQVTQQLRWPITVMKAQ
jgi:hypothetical protein